MPFLSIAGNEVDVVEFVEQPPIILSPKTRSWDGTLRGAVRGQVRHWTGTLNEMTRATYEALLAATDNEAEVPVAGDAMPGAASRTCVVRLGGATYVRSGAGFLVSVPVEILSVQPEA